MLLIVLRRGDQVAGPLLDARQGIPARRVQLGATTDTGDAEGEVARAQARAVSTPSDRAHAGAFRGDVEQVPPMYSALKREGVPLYRLARAGEDGRAQPRARPRSTSSSCSAAQRRSAGAARRCTKGTYIRTLAEDIGAALGCGAHCARCVAPGSGRFRERGRRTLEELARCAEPSATAAAAARASLLAGPAARRARRGRRRRACATASVAKSVGWARAVRAFTARRRGDRPGDAAPRRRCSPLRLTQAADVTQQPLWLKPSVKIARLRQNLIETAKERANGITGCAKSAGRQAVPALRQGDTARPKCRSRC